MVGDLFLRLVLLPGVMKHVRKAFGHHARREVLRSLAIVEYELIVPGELPDAIMAIGAENTRRREVVAPPHRTEYLIIEVDVVIIEWCSLHKIDDVFYLLFRVDLVAVENPNYVNTLRKEFFEQGIAHIFLEHRLGRDDKRAEKRPVCLERCTRCVIVICVSEISVFFKLRVDSTKRDIVPVLFKR